MIGRKFAAPLRLPSTHPPKPSKAPLEKYVLNVLAVAVLITMYLSPPQAAQARRAAIPPYYMCFAYTQDGMFFAGGDYELVRAKKMTSANCGMPKFVKVILVKTIMSHDSKATILYDK